MPAALKRAVTSARKPAFCHRVPTCIGRYIVRRVRHERNLGRTYGGNEFYEILRRISFYIVFGSYHRFEVEHILMRDMSLVWTGMYRYTLSPETLAVHRHLDHIGHIAAASIAQRSYLLMFTLNFVISFSYFFVQSLLRSVSRTATNPPFFTITRGGIAPRTLTKG